MDSDQESQIVLPVSRRAAIGLGVAGGVALAGTCTQRLLAKPPRDLLGRDTSPELNAAYDFVMKKTFKFGPGYWAVLYPEDNFAGNPLLLTEPVLLPKLQTGTMPPGWGTSAGSLVVGPAAVLRVIHKAAEQDVHTTLLPCESLASARLAGNEDGVSTWKLYPEGNLRPPY